MVHQLAESLVVGAGGRAKAIPLWPPGDGRLRRHKCGPGARVVAFDGCSSFRVGFVIQKPLFPKPGALSHPIATTPHSSFQWVGANDIGKLPRGARELAESVLGRVFRRSLESLFKGEQD